MDFVQNKLSKNEWDTLEKPVSEDEKSIIRLIVNGFHQPNICENLNTSLFLYIKTDKTEEIEHYLYNNYFHTAVKKYIEKYVHESNIEMFQPIINMTSLNEGKPLKMIKSADNIRIQHLQSNIEENKDKIFEFLLVEICCNILRYYKKKNKQYIFNYYTLVHLLTRKIKDINIYVLNFCEVVKKYMREKVDVSNMIYYAYDLIENNPYLLKYEDKQLFTHQRQLFQLLNEKRDFQPKLILYTAPTGTGKTLTPIALSEKYRIIFVCVARHIGLAMAKSAISVGKKIAFGFGCDTASDIRLHYFAAKDYKKDWRSGGIFKVNNSVGDNVEIMICDVQSYITCMHYMLAFNSAENVITFWDEPTITLDYSEHELHSTIQNNWKQNIIPTFILSCATLPERNEIIDIEQDFRNKFLEEYLNPAEMYSISSYDCRKSISILDKDGYNALPHYLYENYEELLVTANYIENNKTLLRYIGLQEIVDFIHFVNKYEYIQEGYGIAEYFEEDILKLNMDNIKQYYIVLLKHIIPEKYNVLYDYFKSNKMKKFSRESTELQRTKSLEFSKINEGEPLKRTKSYSYGLNVNKNHKSTGISLTTSDAYTLTDGPTIFLADDVEKIGNFYIQNTSIPKEMFQKILLKIANNNEIVKEIEKLEKSDCFQEKKENTDDDKGKKDKKDKKETFKVSNEEYKVQSEIDKLRKKIFYVSLESRYIPNSVSHQKVWTPDGEVYKNAYVSSIGEEMTKKIMALSVENYCKVLLLLGIGLFSTKNNKDYVEVIKELAEEQRLFIIIASSDYIYGTNYQFCHGFLGKDLESLTQQKIIQAMGRIGRNNIQQQYTVRFRDNNMIKKIFERQEHNIEAINLRRLFSSD